MEFLTLTIELMDGTQVTGLVSSTARNDRQDMLVFADAAGAQQLATLIGQARESDQKALTTITATIMRLIDSGAVCALHVDERMITIRNVRSLLVPEAVAVADTDPERDEHAQPVQLPDDLGTIDGEDVDDLIELIESDRSVN